MATHVKHMFAKLGCSSRSQITRLGGQEWSARPG